jgi:hypothetical protein
MPSESEDRSERDRDEVVARLKGQTDNFSKGRLRGGIPASVAEKIAALRLSTGKKDKKEKNVVDISTATFFFDIANLRLHLPTNLETLTDNGGVMALLTLADHMGLEVVLDREAVSAQVVVVEPRCMKIMASFVHEIISGPRFNRVVQPNAAKEPTARGTSLARAEIVMKLNSISGGNVHTLNSDIPRQYVCDMSEAASGRRLLELELRACFTGKPVSFAFAKTFKSVLSLFLDADEKVLQRIKFHEWFITWDQMVSSVSRQKAKTAGLTKYEKINGKKKKKAAASLYDADGAYLFKAIRPSKPWTLPGVRVCEEQMLQELYGAPWRSEEELKSLWKSQMDSTIRDAHAVVSNFRSKLKQCVEEQWAAKQAVWLALKPRRLWTRAESVKVQNQTLVEEVKKPGYLNHYVPSIPEFNPVMLMPKILTITGPDGNPMQLEREGVNANVRGEDPQFRESFPATYSYVRVYLSQEAAYIARNLPSGVQQKK